MLTLQREQISSAASTLKQLVNAGKKGDSEAFALPGQDAQRYFVYSDGSILRWSDRLGTWQTYLDSWNLALAVATRAA